MKFAHKRHLRELVRSRAGDYEKNRSDIFLDRNERVVPHDERVLKLLSARLANVPLQSYPDVEGFYKKLSGWLGVDRACLYVTEGVSGAIKSLIETIAGEGDNCIFPTPTFALYPVYAKMFNVECRMCGYKSDYTLDVEALMDLMDERTSIVFLPNPNVPIEGTLSVREIEIILKRCRENGTFLVIDEVYYPFGGPTCIGLTGKFDNLFIMRSFSKAFGLAGIRVGYITGRKENIEYVSKTRTGYETNSLSMEVCGFFMDNERLAHDYIDRVKDGLMYLKKEFESMGLSYNGGSASNFIFVNIGTGSLVKDVVYGLKRAGIHVRGDWPEPYSGGISVTGGPVPVMKKFIVNLKRVLANNEKPLPGGRL